VKKNIAIIYTSFLREDLRLKTTNAINRYRPDNSFLFYGIQSRYPDAPQELIAYDAQDFAAWQLPFDCGLSYSRNMMVQCAAEMGIPYCLVTADSIEFTEKYDFSPVVDFLELEPHHGIVGFSLDNKTIWMFNIDIAPGKHFVFSPATDVRLYKGDRYICCDMVSNFFIAKTDCLLANPWDNRLKLLEHEDFFYQLKAQGRYSVFYTNAINARHHSVSDPQYQKYRDRALHEFRDMVIEKYGFKEGYIKDRW